MLPQRATPLKTRHFTTLTSLGTPHDVTLQELWDKVRTDRLTSHESLRG